MVTLTNLDNNKQGFNLITLVSEQIYNTMSVTKLCRPGKSLTQRFLVMHAEETLTKLKPQVGKSDRRIFPKFASIKYLDNKQLFDCQYQE